MARKVDVFVFDRNGNGLSGQRVKFYGGQDVVTNKEGIAPLIVQGDGSTEIYVNGSRIWKGFKGSVPSTLSHKKS